jgi:uncharacterized protein (TIGR00290 family)
MSRRRVLVSWSSGKDSAWTLHRLRSDPDNEIVALLTTLNEAFDRVAMHAVRHELLRLQANAAGVDLWPVMLPYPCSNQQYETLMAKQIERALEAGVTHVAFGDLFLEDIRAYRERMMAGTGLELLFPLWLHPTPQLAREMVQGGLRAWVTCVDPTKLDASFAGRVWDAAFLEELPSDVDPCGENGEFHTFVFAGPMLQHEVLVQPGEVVERDGFVFADVLPVTSAPSQL